MFELLHIEYLLEEIEELFLGHHLVTKHGGGQSLTRSPGLLFCKVSCYHWNTSLLITFDKLGKQELYWHFSILPLVIASYFASQLVITVSLGRPSISGIVLILWKC